MIFPVPVTPIQAVFGNSKRGSTAGSAFGSVSSNTVMQWCEHERHAGGIGIAASAQQADGRLQSALDDC
jgi:hypothetical protein